MARITVDELNAKLLALANEAGPVLHRATGSTAGFVKRNAVNSARARVRRTPRPRASWVRYEVKGTSSGAEAEIRVFGGFAVLAEKGSYKKPNGYIIRPRVRSAGALARRRGWIGPFHHPRIPAQPWWDRGVMTAWPRVPGMYMDAVGREISKHF